MKPLPTSGQKITAKAKNQKANVEEVEDHGDGEEGYGDGGGYRLVGGTFFCYPWTWIMIHFFFCNRFSCILC
jgi:hypothetical protein